TSHRVAAQAVAAGASDYFALPDDRDGLRDALAVAVQRRRAALGRAALAHLEAQAHAFREIVGESPALRAVLERAARIVPHAEATVLITGETGTGKELLARALHYGGPRAAAPFVELNCAALPAPLLESELFGHERGAFTDAKTAKPGLFEVAHGGTMFLDEVDHLAPELQGKLLLALDQGSVRELRNGIERAGLLSPPGTLAVPELARSPSPPPGAGPLPFPARLAEIQRAAAHAMLDATAGNRSEAARRLGISRSRLQRLLEGKDTEDAEADPN